MRIDDLCGERSLIIFLAKSGKQAPARIQQQQQHRGNGQPLRDRRAPAGRDEWNWSGSGPQAGQNFLAELRRRFFVEFGALQRRAQRLLRFQRGDAFRALFQVALEFRGPHGVQFPVEIAVNHRPRKLTAHGRPPRALGWSTPPAVAGGRATARTSPSRSESK